jgi:multicomponent Na+:H+ antiporter subunit E
MSERVSTIAARWAGFFLLWPGIGRTDPANLLVGALTAGAASWTSLWLLPPGAGRLQPAALGRLVWRFLWQSVVAGADVGRRALDPRLPLRPGFVRVRLRLAPGTARDGFCALASLLPGTLPVGTDPDAALCVHCLDVGQDVAAQMSAEERAFLATVGEAAGHG